MTYKGRYAIKPNKPTNQPTFEKQLHIFPAVVFTASSCI